MNLEALIPSLGSQGLMDVLSKGRWHVDHGPISRFPDFLHPDTGALSNIGRLAHWRHFDIGYRDRSGKYNQGYGNGQSALAFYEMGALVRSSAIDEATDATITIIPRGVWHWSESQSPESFAVSLCVNPNSYASMVTQSLYKKYDCKRCIAGLAKVTAAPSTTAWLIACGKRKSF